MVIIYEPAARACSAYSMFVGVSPDELLITTTELLSIRGSVVSPMNQCVIDA